MNDLFGNYDTGYNPRVPESDLIVSLHYIYYQSRVRIVADSEYDERKKNELEHRPKGRLRKFLNSNPKYVVDYPPHIRSLAVYFLFKYMKKTGRWNENKLDWETVLRRRAGKE